MDLGPYQDVTVAKWLDVDRKTVQNWVKNKKIKNASYSYICISGQELARFVTNNPKYAERVLTYAIKQTEDGLMKGTNVDKYVLFSAINVIVNNKPESFNCYIKAVEALFDNLEREISTERQHKEEHLRQISKLQVMRDKLLMFPGGSLWDKYQKGHDITNATQIPGSSKKLSIEEIIKPVFAEINRDRGWDELFIREQLEKYKRTRKKGQQVPRTDECEELHDSWERFRRDHVKKVDDLFSLLGIHKYKKDLFKDSKYCFSEGTEVDFIKEVMFVNYTFYHVECRKYQFLKSIRKNDMRISYEDAMTLTTILDRVIENSCVEKDSKKLEIKGEYRSVLNINALCIEMLEKTLIDREESIKKLRAEIHERAGLELNASVKVQNKAIFVDDTLLWAKEMNTMFRKQELLDKVCISILDNMRNSRQNEIAVAKQMSMVPQESAIYKIKSNLYDKYRNIANVKGFEVDIIATPTQDEGIMTAKRSTSRAQKEIKEDHAFDKEVEYVFESALEQTVRHFEKEYSHEQVEDIIRKQRISIKLLPSEMVFSKSYDRTMEKAMRIKQIGELSRLEMDSESNKNM